MVWITTKTGDGGETSLYDGTRLAKDDPLVCLYGTLDECQAFCGLARTSSACGAVKERMKKLEENLFELMGVLAHSGRPMLAIAELEGWTEEAHQVCGNSFEFLLPGESAADAAFHLARTVARRAERLAVPLLRSGVVTKEQFAYINRLSDVIYALLLWERAEAKGRPEEQGQRACISSNS